MIYFLKNIKRRIIHIFRKEIKRRKVAWENYKRYLEWIKNGRYIPPPHIYKQKTVLRYAKKYNISTFVETGTYYGDMVEAMKSKFHKIISIELSPQLFEIAKNRFRQQKHIKIIQGDSTIVLPKVLEDINSPTLFWLDGHFSGGITAKGDIETPIKHELNIILGHEINEHVLIIDDARQFGHEPDYPSIDELISLIKSKRDDLDIQVKYDIIRITPKKE